MGWILVFGQFAAHATIAVYLVAEHIINAGGGTAGIAHLTDDGREIN